METSDQRSFSPTRSGLLIAALCCLSFVAWAQSPKTAPEAVAAVPADAGTPIHWMEWSDSVFAQARTEHKFVLLDLEAVWCHWCHVMDAVTYADPAIRKVMAEKYLAVKVDQDARPDISNRYEDYGWPATVVFDDQGKEIVKRQGYMPPKPMLSMLEAIIEDPTPGPSVVPEQPITYAAGSTASPALLARVRRNYEAQYDLKAGGWGFSHKFLDPDSAEYALVLARAGNAIYTRRFLKTLHLEEKIQDPVWGGAYQYSAGGDWDEPHFEKLIFIQAQVMRIYALAYAQFKDPAYLDTASKIDSYVHTFLTSPEGAFYVSQDADLVEGEHGGDYFKLDDAARRKLGIPRVDKHLYARENGWMITALADLYAVSGNPDFLTQARHAAAWVLANRALPNGGFRHDAPSHDVLHAESDRAAPYLADTLAMGQAFLALYQVTADAKWLDHAKATLPFIADNFTAPVLPGSSGPDGQIGFMTSKAPTDGFAQALPERDENIALARFANLLYQYTGDAKAQTITAQAMRYLVTPAIAERPLSAGTLLAIHETTQSPLHVTIVGAKEDPAAQQFFATALASLRSYERLEWLPDPNTVDNSAPSIASTRKDVSYPTITQAAGFLCEQGSCGAPIYTQEALRSRIEAVAGTPPTLPAGPSAPPHTTARRSSTAHKAHAGQ